MKYFSWITRIAVLAAALIFWLSPAALHAQSVSSSSLQVPLAGTVFVPLTDGNVEGVALSGFAHVFAQVRTPGPLSPTDPYRIQINLDSVSGVGDVTALPRDGGISDQFANRASRSDKHKLRFARGGTAA